jgi:hypothetical protein
LLRADVSTRCQGIAIPYPYGEKGSNPIWAHRDPISPPRHLIGRNGPRGWAFSMYSTQRDHGQQRKAISVRRSFFHSRTGARSVGHRVFPHGSSSGGADRVHSQHGLQYATGQAVAARAGVPGRASGHAHRACGARAVPRNLRPGGNERRQRQMLSARREQW